MTIIAALKKLFSLSDDPKTIAEALDEAEISGGGGLPEVTTADKKKSLAVNATTGQWEVSDRVVVVENGSADLTNGSCRSSYAPVWATATSQYQRMKVTWLPATGSENKNKTGRCFQDIQQTRPDNQEPRLRQVRRGSYAR